MPCSSDDPLRFPRRRVERAAALLSYDRSEPAATLYTQPWTEARARLAALGGAKCAVLWGRLLDHQERGWEYVRPLARAAEEAKGRTPEQTTTTILYQFADVETVDLFRYNAFRCVEMALGPGHPGGVVLADDIDADTDAFYRSVTLLRLASAHRAMPPELRLLVDHLAGLDDWYAEFGSVFKPAAAAYYRILRRLGVPGV